MTSMMKTAVAAGVLMAAASCGAPEDQENQAVDSIEAAHHQDRCRRGPEDIPAALAVPAGTCLKEKVLGTGVQIYTCTAGAWVLKAPEANLTDRHGRFQGNHFLGPTWQWNDGSKIKAARTAGVNAPDPADVPWLLLGVTGEDGDGTLADVTQVQRVHTSGGVAPAGACTEAAEVRVPYSADYLFYAPTGK
jgi:hypothetical protein